MIFFYCPDCKEELEAEESIRGVKMQCPACSKEITVPQVSVKVTSRVKRDGRGSTDPGVVASPSVVPGGKFILVVLIAGTLGLLAIAGLGIALTRHARDQVLQNRPKCDVCNSQGAVDCTMCKGTKKVPCKDIDCKNGKRLNFRGDPEECFACSGAGHVDCAICGGRGKYSCSGCRGTGYLGK